LIEEFKKIIENLLSKNIEKNLGKFLPSQNSK